MNAKAKLIIVLAMFCIANGRTQNQNIMTEKKLKIDKTGAEINYYHQGGGDTNLLFLHGWCINATYWYDQLNFFAANYSVYAMDLSGFGKSIAQRENWSIQNYAKDIIDFIESLQLTNVVLIGHSMSGDIMLEAALSNNHRIIGLVGIDNFKFIEVEFTQEQVEQYQEFFNYLRQDFKNAAPAYADKMLFHSSTPENVKVRVKADFGASDPNIGVSSLVSYMQNANELSTKLNRLNYKLVLINSDAIPTNEAGLQTTCKMGFEVKTIHATGHYPMVEKPKEFNKILSDALKIKP